MINKNHTHGFSGLNPNLAPFASHQVQQWDIVALSQKVDYLCSVISTLVQQLPLGGINSPVNGIEYYAPNSWHPTVGAVSPIQSLCRTRETLSHFYYQVYCPVSDITDFEFECGTNMIVCRSKRPVGNFQQIFNTAVLPRGFEVLELPNGRIEYIFTFANGINSKNVEISLENGCLCIWATKVEVTQFTKLTKDNFKTGHEARMS